MQPLTEVFGIFFVPHDSSGRTGILYSPNISLHPGDSLRLTYNTKLTDNSGRFLKETPILETEYRCLRTISPGVCEVVYCGL